MPPAADQPMPELRYVILRHEGVPSPHFDLMFETAPGSPLATWRSDVWPVAGSTPVTRIADHRPAYLDFEGELSGGRGRVRRVEAGRFRVELFSPDRLEGIARAAAEARRLAFSRRAADAWEASTEDANE